MRRRQFLTATAASSLLPVSGCLDIQRGPKSLGSPRVEMEANGLEKHLIFTDSSADQVIITINQRWKPRSLNRPVPFRFHVWHRKGLSIDRLHFDIRSPGQSNGLPAQVYLKVPEGGPWPEFRFRRDGHSWTVLSVRDLGQLGEGSLTLDLLLNPISGPAERLAVRTEVDLSESGLVRQQYRARAKTDFEIRPADG